MFGFGQECKKIVELIIENSKLKNKIIFLEYEKAMNYEIINSEAKRLKPDHWDKEAFDRLIEMTNTQD